MERVLGTRFNVFHHRRVAEGLLLEDVGDAASTADLVLPAYGQRELREADAPPLFFSLPEPMAEFKRSSIGRDWNVINANKSFTYLSKFLHLDQRTDTDDGSFRGGASEGALDALGRLVPSGWLWVGKGFYDNRPGSWASHPGVDYLDYAEFRRRVKAAAYENARYQDATEMSPSEMAEARDKENCFRIAELGIGASDVVVMGKPVPRDGDIEIAAPSAVSMANFKSVLEKGSDVDEPRFVFRILKGHNIDNLLKQRAGSVQAYLGFAGIGALTVAYGEELIRDSVEVTYLL